MVALWGEREKAEEAWKAIKPKGSPYVAICFGTSSLSLLSRYAALCYDGQQTESLRRRVMKINADDP